MLPFGEASRKRRGCTIPAVGCAGVAPALRDAGGFPSEPAPHVAPAVMSVPAVGLIFCRAGTRAPGTAQAFRVAVAAGPDPPVAACARSRPGSDASAGVAPRPRPLAPHRRHASALSPGVRRRAKRSCRHTRSRQACILASARTPCQDVAEKTGWLITIRLVWHLASGS